MVAVIKILWPCLDKVFLFQYPVSTGKFKDLVNKLRISMSISLFLVNLHLRFKIFDLETSNKMKERKK